MALFCGLLSMSSRIIVIWFLMLFSRSSFSEESLILNVSTSINKINFYDYSIVTHVDRPYIPLRYDRESELFLDEEIVVTNSTNIPSEERGFYYEYDIQSLTSYCEVRGEVVFEDFMGLKINDVSLEDYLTGDKGIALEKTNSSGFLQASDILTLSTQKNIPNDDIYYCSGQLSYMVSLSL